MKRTHKILAFTLSAVFVAASLSACQPTPDKPIVNAGDDSVLNDKIEATAVPTPENEENIGSTNDFPTSKQDEFTCIDEDVGFTVRANVYVPSIKSVPVLEIMPTAITTEFVKDFIDKMSPGLTWYERLDQKLTKAKVEEFVKKYEEELSCSYDEFVKNYAEGSGITDEESARNYYEQSKYCLEEYKRRLAAMSDEPEKVVTDFSFHHLDFYSMDLAEIDYTRDREGYVDTDERRFLQIAAYDDSGEMCASVTAENRIGDDVKGSFGYVTSLDNPPEQLTNENAVILAEQALAKIGKQNEMEQVNIQYYYYDNDVCAGPYDEPDESKMPAFVSVCYRRSINGLTVLDTIKNNDYNYVSGNETLTISIYDDGDYGIAYENPYIISKVENENIELLPFENIYSAFKRQAEVEYTKFYVSGGYSGDTEISDPNMFENWHAVINEIKFGLVRIPIKNGGSRYVPAWQFCGQFSGKKQNGDEENSIGTKLSTVLMTINAVDGTRIAGMQ